MASVNYEAKGIRSDLAKCFRGGSDGYPHRADHPLRTTGPVLTVAGILIAPNAWRILSAANMLTVRSLAVKPLF